MSRYLVTGAQGFLGRHLVSALLEDGHEVHSLVRRPPVSAEDDARATFSVGDVLDRGGSSSTSGSLDRAMDGADGVFHCAGRVSRDPQDAEALFDLHVRGTRSVIDSARAAGVRRVVVASTSGTVGISEDPSFVATEDSPTPHGLISRFPYYRSKLYQEQEALAAGGAGLDVLCVNPSLLLGPGDSHGSSTADVWLFLSRSIPATPRGGMAFVDVRDAARGMIQAMERGVSGRRYLLNGANVTVREFFERLSRLSGVPVPRLSLPRSRAVSVAATRALERVVATFGGEVPVSVSTVEMGCLFWYVDAARASRELGFAPRDPTTTLADTVNDLQRKRP